MKTPPQCKCPQQKSCASLKIQPPLPSPKSKLWYRRQQSERQNKDKRRKNKEYPPPPKLPNDATEHWSHEYIKSHQEREPILSIVITWVKSKDKPQFDTTTEDRQNLSCW